MGGFGSGRYGGRPTVDGGLTLDLYKLIRDGLLRPSSGTLTWTYVGSGERVASVPYHLTMGDQRGWMRLAEMISSVTTPVFMAIVYFVVVTPIGWMARLAGHRPLVRQPTDGSYWVTRAPGDRQSTLSRQC